MKYLGIDYGLRKVGLSISEGQIASPLRVVEVSGLKDALNKIKQAVVGEKIDRVVIGVPESGEIKKAIKNFIQEFKKEIEEKQVEIIETEETLSSHEAKEFMIELNLSQKAREKEDAYSAVLILQRFLNSLS